MKRELFKFIESIPANAGYSNYEYFKEGATVYIVKIDDSIKYCILCDDEGITMLDEEGEEIFLDWCSEDSLYPIWEDKLLPYKEVEVFDDMDGSYYICLNSSEISAINLKRFVNNLPDNATIYLDTDNVLFKEYLEKYGVNRVIPFLEKDNIKVIAVLPPAEEVPDINDLFDSLEGQECLTINFHENDLRKNK